MRLPKELELVNEHKLGFNQDHGGFSVRYLRKDGSIVSINRALCFAFVLDPKVIKGGFSVLEAIFEDNVTPVVEKQIPNFKRKNLAKWYMKVLEDMGLFRNLTSYNIRSGKIKTVWNADRVKALELYIVGNMIRMIDAWPAYVYNLYKYHKLLPKYPLSRMVFAMYGIKGGPYNTYLNCNHSLLSGRYFGHMKGDVNFIFKLIDEAPRDTVSLNKQLRKNLPQVSSAIATETLNGNGWRSNDEVTPELLDSFLSEEGEEKYREMKALMKKKGEVYASAQW